MPRGTSVYDEAKLQGRLWTPLTLRSAIGNEGLSVFVEAYDKSTVTGSGGEWTGIKNKSGRGYDFSTISGGMTYVPLEPFIDFQGSPDGMQALSTDPIRSLLPNDRGSMVVTAIFSSGIIIVKIETDFSGNSRVGLEGSQRSDWYNDISGNGSNQGWSEQWSSSVLKVGSITKNTTDSYIRLNGSEVDNMTNTSTPTDTATAAGMSMGCDPGGVNHGVCKVAQWIVVSQSDDMTRNRLDGYAAWALRYEGNYLRAPLVGSHPFVNRPPLLGT